MASTSGRDPASLAVRSWAGMIKRTIGTLQLEPIAQADDPAGQAEPPMWFDPHPRPEGTWRAMDQRLPVPAEAAAAEAEQRYDDWRRFIIYTAGARNADGGFAYTVADALAAGSQLARCSGPGWASWSPAGASDLFGDARRTAMAVPESVSDQRLPREVMADACDLYSRRQAAAFAARRAEADRAWQDYQRAMLAADTDYETAMAAASAEYDRVVSPDA